MDVLKTIKPGEPGSRRFLPRYGERLVAVRYRKDLDRAMRLTTIEVIVDQSSLSDNQMVVPS